MTYESKKLTFASNVNITNEIFMNAYKFNINFSFTDDSFTNSFLETFRISDSEFLFYNKSETFPLTIFLLRPYKWLVS